MSDEIRAFIALEINNSDTIKNIKILQQKLSDAIQPLRIKLVELENLHLTLRFLGNISLKQAKEIYNFIESNINVNYFNNQTLKFVVTKLGDFKGRTFFTDLSGPTQTLVKIHDKIEKYLVDYYHFDPEKSFKTHITIGRLKEDYGYGKHGKSQIKGEINPKLYELKKNYQNEILGDVEFTKVLLKKSTLTPKGPIYENLIFK